MKDAHHLMRVMPLCDSAETLEHERERETRDAQQSALLRLEIVEDADRPVNLLVTTEGGEHAHGFSLLPLTSDTLVMGKVTPALESDRRSHLPDEQTDHS